MSERQRGWNKYEAAILLEGLLDVLNNGASRRNIIRRVSCDLRKMAKSQGEIIDEIFRNENGISFQLQSMESAYKGYTDTKPATKLFTDVVNIYQQNRTEYDKLLREARTMINSTQSCESDFMNWLSSKVSPAQLSELYLCYAEIENSCKNANILKKPLFETTDLDTVKAVLQHVEQSLMFRIRHKRQLPKFAAAARHYYTYIKEITEKEQLDEVEAHVLGNNSEFMEMKKASRSDVEEKSVSIPTSREIFLEPEQEEFASVSVEQMIPNVTKIESQRDLLDEHEVESANSEGAVQKQTETLPVRTCEDERLLAKYPIIYKRVFSALRDSFKEERIVTVGELQKLTQRIGRASDIEEILDNVSWSKSEGDGYVFSDEIVSHDDEEKENNKNSVEEPTAQNELMIDFNNLGGFAHTKPCSFTYFNEKKVSCSSWTELYVLLFSVLYDDYPLLFRPGMSFSTYKGRIELALKDEAEFMIAPRSVPGTDLVIEVNISATDIVQKVKYLLDLCAVDYENVVITYRRKELTREAVGQVGSQPENQCEQQLKVVDRQSFYQYLMTVQRLSESTSRSYSYAIGSCETFAKEHHYESWRLYTSDLKEAKVTVDTLYHDRNFTEYNDQWHNQLRAAIAKLLVFINDDHENIEIGAMAPRTASPTPTRDFSYMNEPYEKVLKEKFQRGFRLDSAIELRRFKKFYADMHGVDVNESDDEIISIIRRLCILYDDRAYQPDAMLSPELKTKLFDYIEKCFNDGKTTIYYQALCTEFAEDFIDYPLHNNPDALKVYISDVGSGKFYINRTCISKEANVTTDPLTEIRECLKKFGRPVKFEELFTTLPHLPQSKIKSLLAANAEFVSNGQGAYFHESIVRLSDEELENIASIIEQTIGEKDFIGGNEVYDEIKVMYPYIIEENSELSVYGFRDALKYKFGDRFSFKGNIISAAGKELAMADVFANYARKHDSFTLTELETLAHELASTIYFDSVYENSLRINQEQFVSKDRAQFNVPEVDAAMDRICSGDYVAIKQVNNFAVFPYVGFPWNSFLLEHYVAAYSEKYTLLHAGFNRVECAGAIVKRSANINSFDDFIVELLKSTDVELKKTSVLQMLVQEGYLVRRRYANIEDLIIRAKAQRNRKETD